MKRQMFFYFTSDVFSTLSMRKADSQEIIMNQNNLTMLQKTPTWPPLPLLIKLLPVLFSLFTAIIGIIGTFTVIIPFLGL